MKIGDLIKIISHDSDYWCYGVFLGMADNPPTYKHVQHSFLRGGNIEYYDEPFWKFEVINEISSQ